MQEGNRKRSPVEIQTDTDFAIRKHLQGASIKKIAQELSLMKGFDVTYSAVARDIRNYYDETELTPEEQISAMDDILYKYSYIYATAMSKYEKEGKSIDITNAMKALETVAKLKGLFVERTQSNINITDKYYVGGPDEVENAERLQKEYDEFLEYKKNK